MDAFERMRASASDEPHEHLGTRWHAFHPPASPTSSTRSSSPPKDGKTGIRWSDTRSIACQDLPCHVTRGRVTNPQCRTTLRETSLGLLLYPAFQAQQICNRDPARPAAGLSRQSSLSRRIPRGKLQGGSFVS